MLADRITFSLLFCFCYCKEIGSFNSCHSSDKKQVCIPGTLKAAELSVHIFPFHRNGVNGAILLVPFTHSYHTQGYRKHFSEIQCLCASKHLWAQFRSEKNIGGIQIKGLRPGEIPRQGGKDGDCAVRRQQIWRRNSMAEGGWHGLKLWFVKRGLSFTLTDQAVQRTWRELQPTPVMQTPVGKSAADLGLSVKNLVCRGSILFYYETNENHCKGTGLHDL